MAIREGSLPTSSLIARRLGSIGVLLCASPDYLKRCGPVRSIDELSERDCLVNDLVSWGVLRNAAVAGLGIAYLRSRASHSLRRQRKHGQSLRIALRGWVTS